MWLGRSESGNRQDSGDQEAGPNTEGFQWSGTLDPDSLSRASNDETPNGLSMLTRIATKKLSTLVDMARKTLDHLEEQIPESRPADFRHVVKTIAHLAAVNRRLATLLVAKRTGGGSATKRILGYLKLFVGEVIEGEELMVVSGISEWARRIRELRVQEGFLVSTGNSRQDLKVHQYVLEQLAPDADAARRWKLANSIRTKSGPAKARILAFFRANIGRAVHGEEIRYVAREGTSEWARRLRELRTEEGWPVYGQKTGRPDLSMSQYVLEADRQTEPHDRKISDSVRLEVLERDDYSCVLDGWNQSRWSKLAPRWLEVHHKKPHAEKGSNRSDNLMTLCNVCHDEIHAKRKRPPS